jgi:hypothetical protein
MSEESENNDGTWSGLKKTIIGLITTAVTAGAAYFTSNLFGGKDEGESVKTEQIAPAPAPVINLNVDNSSQNNSSNGGNTHTIIREVEKPASQTAPSKPKKEEEDPW